MAAEPWSTPPVPEITFAEGTPSLLELHQMGIRGLEHLGDSLAQVHFYAEHREEINRAFAGQYVLIAAEQIFGGPDFATARARWIEAGAPPGYYAVGILGVGG